MWDANYHVKRRNCSIDWMYKNADEDIHGYRCLREHSDCIIHGNLDTRCHTTNYNGNCSWSVRLQSDKCRHCCCIWKCDSHGRMWHTNGHVDGWGCSIEWVYEHANKDLYRHRCVR